MLEPVYVERTKLYRVMTKDVCWKCADREATTEIGLCPPCYSILQDK